MRSSQSGFSTLRNHLLPSPVRSNASSANALALSTYLVPTGSGLYFWSHRNQDPRPHPRPTVPLSQHPRHHSTGSTPALEPASPVSSRLSQTRHCSRNVQHPCPSQNPSKLSTNSKAPSHPSGRRASIPDQPHSTANNQQNAGFDSIQHQD